MLAAEAVARHSTRTQPSPEVSALEVNWPSFGDRISSLAPGRRVMGARRPSERLAVTVQGAFRSSGFCLRLIVMTSIVNLKLGTDEVVR